MAADGYNDINGNSDNSLQFLRNEYNGTAVCEHIISDNTVGCSDISCGISSAQNEEKMRNGFPKS